MDEKELKESINHRLMHRRPGRPVSSSDVLMWCNTLMLIYLVIKVYGWI